MLFQSAISMICWSHLPTAAGQDLSSDQLTWARRLSTTIPGLVLLHLINQTWEFLSGLWPSPCVQISSRLHLIVPIVHLILLLTKLPFHPHLACWDSFMLLVTQVERMWLCKRFVHRFERFGMILLPLHLFHLGHLLLSYPVLQFLLLLQAEAAAVVALA